MDRVWHRKFINVILVHEIVSHLGKLNSIGALSGYDTNSFISSKGKIAFWDIWKLMSEITPIFAKQSNFICKNNQRELKAH